jgi:hypothetical protein
MDRGYRYGQKKETLEAHHLARGHADGLDGELAAAHVKEVLETGAEEVDYEDVVQALLSEVVYLGNSGWTGSGPGGGTEATRLTTSRENAVGAALVA